MAKRIYPTYWSQWFGKFAIGYTKSEPPSVLYIVGMNRYGSMIAKKVNTGIVGFVKPRELIDYSPRLFDRLDAAWKLKEAHRVIDCQTKRLLSGK
ncbi:MAG: hypothetical protein K9L79_01395 [Methylobacter tundripaludum]|nr:hypothetical protein [Methylobacter tundripaludum]